MTAYEPLDTLEVFGGDIIYAADLNDVTRQIPRTYTKELSTARASTTTYANDPELTNIPLEVGRFDIELVGFFTLTTTNTQKIKTRWAFSGTVNNLSRACFGPGSNQVADRQNVTETNVGGPTITTQDSIYDTAASSAYSSFRERAMEVVVTVAGNLDIQWAQAASVANNTTLHAGTSVIVRRYS